MALATACGGDDEEQQQAAAEAAAAKKRAAAGASTVFIPADPSPQPALPPGAGPYNGPPPIPDQPPPPVDAGTDTGPKDTGSQDG